MGIVIFVLIIWLSFKILEWSFPSSSDSNNDKETSNYDNVAIDSNSNEEPSSYNVGDIDSNNNKETFNHDVGAIDDKPSDLKYNNEVYISLRNKLQKAYESFKKSGYDIEWDSNIDGFLMFENDSSSVDDQIYSVEIHYDDQNLFELKDPFYIVKYGIIFERSDHDDYIEKADYLNNSEKRKPAIFYTTNIIKDSNFGVYYANLIIADHKTLCEDAEKLGEVELFELLILGAVRAYLEGEEIYDDKIRNENTNHDVGAIDSNSDKENYSHIVEATDDKPSDLKYDNEVYISFRNIVQKTYESYKKSGYNISWKSDLDGFTISEDGSLSVGSSMYIVHVQNEDPSVQNEDLSSELDNQFCIVVAYGVLIERINSYDYEVKAEYLNNRETKESGIFYNLSNLKDPNLGVFYCNMVINDCDYNYLCKRTKELGEAEFFKRLMSEAREFYYEGQELFGDEVLRGAKNSSK